jgi:para-aminobenzoate synthetase component 1
MPTGGISDTLARPAPSRPAILEGRWLGAHGGETIQAASPISVIEGHSNSLAELPAWLARHVEQFPEGAAIGYFAYELARVFERLPICPAPDLPDFSFAYYPWIERVREPGRAPGSPPAPAEVEVLSDFNPARFISDVERIRHYIAAGDIYQANLTQQFVARVIEGVPERTYARLRPTGAAMRAFLKWPRLTILSNSPERFFHVRGDRIRTSPIKGTLMRGNCPAEDEELRKKLLSSSKDRAENVMIVDLLRNDLGRICRYETIQARLWEVDPLPHLFHLVSHVEGTLRPHVGLLEILRALFPCGSITGAPKIRAMEILAELEPVPRGVSMGAIGIIVGAPGRPGFEMDFNVAIRTITVHDNVATFNVGCGIVYDSIAEAEYQEMLLKARPLLEALGIESLVVECGRGRIVRDQLERPAVVDSLP